MTLLTSKKMYPEFLHFFENAVFHGISPLFDAKIAFHTDLYFMKFSEEIIVAAPEMRTTIEKNPIFENYTVLFGESPSSPYPSDVKYNAFTVGNRLFCNTKHTDPIILETARAKNYEIIHINQGYAKCSAIPLSNETVITSDIGICKKAREHGIDALLVGNDGVLLDGFPNGFIGGTCAVSESEIFFSGNIDAHPNGEQIRAFAKKHGKKVSHIPTLPLYDFGSPILL